MSNFLPVLQLDAVREAELISYMLGLNTVICEDNKIKGSNKVDVFILRLVMQCECKCVLPKQEQGV